MRVRLNDFQRCPGCGNFIILTAIKQALGYLQIPSHQTVIVSGIGCSGKMPQHINCYGAETLHGRAIPFAIGVKLANPNLTVLAYGGDGDGYGIGLGHLLHAARRNIDITYIVADNQTYGLTTGQASPTTPYKAKTSTTPKGNMLKPLDPISLLRAVGCESVFEVSDKNVKDLTDAIIAGIQYPGFSHIRVLQTCPSWKKR